MSTSKSALDAFEQRLKNSLDQYEVPYNSTDWSDLQHSLDGGRARWWTSSMGVAMLFIGTLGLALGGWYFLSEKTSTEVGNAAASAPVDTRSSLADERDNVSSDTAPMVQPMTSEAPEVTASAGTSVATRIKKEKPANEPEQNRSPASPTGANLSEKAMAVPQTSRTEVLSKSTAPAISTHLDENGKAKFTASLSEGCVGTSVDFKVEHMPEDGIYLWNFGDGSFSNKANPEHTFTKPGSYQVMLSMSAAGVGTIHNKPSSDLIVIHDVPRAAFNVLKQEYDGHLPSIHFENRSLSGKEYLWNFGDGETSTIAHPDHIYKKKGVYQVELTVTNEIGCVDMLMKEVRIDKDYNLDAPASFSPNGDGNEETFMPEALRTLGLKFKLSIYDPNGALVYETTDATKPWLGRMPNRTDAAPADEYVWVADVKESLHLSETYTGKVKLVR